METFRRITNKAVRKLLGLLRCLSTVALYGVTHDLLGGGGEICSLEMTLLQSKDVENTAPTV